MRKIILTIAGILLLSLSSNLLAQWVQVNTGTSTNLYKISAFDNDRLICSSHNGSVLISDDFGETWQDIPLTYQKVTGLDCWGNRAIAVSDFGNIYTSVDYGETWSENHSLDYQIRGAEFYDYDKAYLCGQGELLWESSENFSFWNPNPYVFGEGYWFRDIAFTDTMNGYVAGDGGQAFKTPNGGYGWFKMNTKTTENLMSISFPTPDTGYICGHNSVILKTTDGGITWEDVLNSNIDDLRGAWFLNPDTGYICGWNGVILHTFDGGATWEQELSGVSTDLTKFYYLDTIKRLIAIGHEGTVLYKDLDDVSIPESNNDISNKLFIKPNPAKNTVVINLNHMTTERSGRLYIYNSNGSLIKSMMLSDLLKDQFIDISQLNPGIYHVCFEGSSGEIESGTFIKQ